MRERARVGQGPRGRGLAGAYYAPFAVGAFIGQVKGSASHLAAKLSAETFAWQSEYGIISISENQLAIVISYVQNQQQHQQLKFNPVKLFHQTMSNNSNNSPTHSGGGSSAQRPILGIPSRPGFSSPGLIPTPSSTASTNFIITLILFKYSHLSHI